ncbi:ecdysteroid 22-kinase family protein [Aestuariicella sp. G3-2]|uniref:phosphotransferase n=1 Tax=Pseudomaricurvus albidus TaxID=2842452 RepID=UPI001C0DA351|nr:phosphotransferase [Aestuariicella albida]MBU3070143.1 ecdysteroid 22-kinase family protein [Aestuariicella albida]
MDIQSHLTQLLGAHQADPVETLQELWSGYGSIVRFRLDYSSKLATGPSSVVVKTIQPPEQVNHPRGWNTPLSHQRKLKSYEVEAHWYREWANLCETSCKVAHCYGTFTDHQRHLTYIILEDLDASGYYLRADDLSPQQSKVCLRWLANFHARFLTRAPTESWPEGLWPKGSYWHLDTRPDELDKMTDGALKQNAFVIDQRLHQCQYKTLVHGDAKVANFCFSEDGQKVAAVDFQYVGGGCGMKDVVYFLGSCLTETECEKYCPTLLNEYFLALREAAANSPAKDLNLDELECEWRALFPFAWADFQRFILGWSPNHKKNNDFSQQQTRLALSAL